MNSYLKDIADACRINKNLTYHTARHTFATTATSGNGVPIEIVYKMPGHKNIKTTQHYAKILDKKIIDDMKSLRSKFSTQQFWINILSQGIPIRFITVWQINNSFSGNMKAPITPSNMPGR